MADRTHGELRVVEASRPTREMVLDAARTALRLTRGKGKNIVDQAPVASGRRRNRRAAP